MAVPALFNVTIFNTAVGDFVPYWSSIWLVPYHPGFASVVPPDAKLFLPLTFVQVTNAHSSWKLQQRQAKEASALYALYRKKGFWKWGLKEY